jgi:glycosyltransferase involved in cell wall biosynthesis
MELPFYCSAPKRLTASSAWHQHIPFAMHLIEVLKPEIIVELGTYKGDSYCSFCQAIQELQLNTRCFAVDTWRGDEQGGYFGTEVLEDLRAYHDPLYGSFSKLMQCSFNNALPHFANKTIDILHIDGYHTYEAVRHDFYSWLPKISRRGIILLHDTNERERNFGVWRLWDEVKEKYPHFEFPHGHGLGILGVGEDQNALLHELFQTSQEDIANIRKFFASLGERITSQVATEAELERLRLLIAEKERTIQTIGEQKDRAILELKAQLSEKEQAVQILSKQKDSPVHRLEIQSSRNNQVARALKWKTIQFFDLIRDKSLPQGTQRRRIIVSIHKSASNPLIMIPKLKKFFWYCRIYGFRNATRLAIRKLHQAQAPTLKIRPLCTPSSAAFSQEEELPFIYKRISVVVPTKNAGDDFPFLLKKLKSQKGLCECEIIIVDSGSTDQTLEAAKNEGATIIEIPPETFNHADARNRGAASATGDYVLFLVQDALPMTDKWLWEMARTLEQNKTVAVSCAEYPRSDCDLFYQHLIWSHYRTLNLDKDRFLSWDESCSSQLGLRSNSQISDIAALIKLDVFNQYKYKTKFAEDLDLGIRLIKDGHRIGFLYSTRVIHSHNRPAYYFLKRAYVDSKFLKEVFTGIQFPAITNQIRLFQDIAAIYYKTKTIAPEITETNKPEGVGRLFHRIKSLYSSEPNGMEDIATAVPENDFEDLVRSLALSTGEKNIRYKSRDNLLLPHFLQHLGVLQAFLSKSHQNIDPSLLGDLLNALFKILALDTGSHLAYLYLTLFDQKPSEEFWAVLDKQLTSGI